MQLVVLVAGLAVAFAWVGRGPPGAPGVVAGAIARAGAEPASGPAPQPVPLANCAPGVGSRAAHEVFFLAGDAPADRFGAALACAGDVDGDGRADLLVGAPNHGLVQPGAGRVALVSADGALLWQVDGGEAFARLGAAAAGVGDIDGDGVPDAAVGEPQGAAGRGRVRVLSGSSGALLLQVDGAATGDRFGASLAGCGDVDGDGVPDLVVGAPHSDAGGTNAGEVSIHSGFGGSRLAAWTGAPFDLLGQASDAAGDVDGDGVPDVLAGAPFADVAAFDGGAMNVLPGHGGGALAVLAGASVGDQLGTWVSGLGDVDGDGVPDAAAGAPGDDRAALDAGAAHVRSGATGDVLLVVTGDEPGGYAGVVAATGDVDGDGRSDLAFGAPGSDAAGPEAGCVRLVSASGAELCAAGGFRAFGWLGAALAGVGDLDGDGRPEVAAGAPVHDDHLGGPGRVAVVGCVPFEPGAGADPPLGH